VVAVLMGDSEEQLDNSHLMRLAGRLSRRVRGFAKGAPHPVNRLRRGDRSNDIARSISRTLHRPWTVHGFSSAARSRYGRPAFSGGGIHLTKSCRT